ncbi:PREDICTED: putative defensin-like protein 23, partial [Camelina sativa]|uniref:Defensin-like protein 23 n=1 Tax=Camelina sativa TaxID=90675 RepID=A0ABM1QTH8_CAMSA
MTTTMKIMSFAMLLVLLFSIDVVVEGSDSSLCCNTHAKFGACKT